MRCKITRIISAAGRMKWRLKNSFNVKSLILNPDHTIWTVFIPMIGITVMNFVITVAAQYLIWFHGKT